jgi:general secretion pathway protein K
MNSSGPRTGRARASRSPAAGRRRCRPRRRGVALLAVMWVAILAGLILLGINVELRVHLAMAHNELASVQAHWLARAGIEQAVALLEDDDDAVDSALDAWFDDPLTLKNIDLASGQFSVVGPAWSEQDPTLQRFGLIDHAGRLNLNLADGKRLASLTDLSDAQVAAILDWRDGDDKLLAGGAERGYYEHLPFPYRIRNGPFRTPRELLLVRGIDLSAFHGEDADDDGLLDRREDDGDKTPPRDNADGKLQLGLAGLTTVFSYERNVDDLGNERVNLNTADKQELTSKLGLSDALAQGVINRRGSNKFAKVMDLLDVKPARSGSPGGNRADGKPSGVNEMTLKWLAEHLDELTVTDEERLPGRVNVNTAPRAVLMALPEMTDAAADAIVKQRESAIGPFLSVGELFTGSALNEKQFKAMAELLTVRSSVFEIRATGTTSRGIRRQITAVVDRGVDPIAILYWHQSE